MSRRHTIILPDELSSRVEQGGNVSGQIQRDLITLYSIYDNARVDRQFSDNEQRILAAHLAQLDEDVVNSPRRARVFQDHIRASKEVDYRTRGKVCDLSDPETYALIEMLFVRVHSAKETLKDQMFRDVIRHAKDRSQPHPEDVSMNEAVSSYLLGNLHEHTRV